MKSIDCKILFVALVAFAASMLPETARAQQNIDKVISEYVEASRGTLSYRSVVKRNPSTRQIAKRVVELSVRRQGAWRSSWSRHSRPTASAPTA